MNLLYSEWKNYIYFLNNLENLYDYAVINSLLRAKCKYHVKNVSIFVISTGERYEYLVIDSKSNWLFQLRFSI